MVQRWLLGKEILKTRQLWIRDFQLFDLLKAGVQARTKDTGLIVVNRDTLPKERRNALAYYEKDEWKDAAGNVVRISIGGAGGPMHAMSELSDDIKKKIAQQEWGKQPEDQWIDPDGCISISFTLPNKNPERWLAINKAEHFLYLAGDVEKYFGGDDIQSTSLLSQETQSVVADHQNKPAQAFKEDTHGVYPNNTEPHQDTAPAPAAPPVELVPSVTDYIGKRRTEGAKNEIIAYELSDKKGNFKLTYLDIARKLDFDKDLHANQIGAIKQRGRRACKKGKVLLQKQ